MPRSAMVSGTNAQLQSQSLARIVTEFPEEAERLGERGSLVPVARTVLDLSDEDAAYLEAIPSALREALRAAIYDALASEKSVQMQFSPGYDFSIQFWDYGEAVSVHLSGPYEIEGYESSMPIAMRRAAGAKKTRAKTASKKTTSKKTSKKKAASRSSKRGR